MKIIVTGATGFVGRALSLRLQRDGHHVIAWTRDPDRARSALGAAVEFVNIAADDDAARSVRAADAIINLAGEPLLAGRWTETRRAALRASRVGLTERLVSLMAATDASARPKVLVSASAVGYYGERVDHGVGESAPAGSDFLAELCREWEGAASGARSLGARVALIRIGVVLGSGGALAQMLPPFRLGLGGRLGSGRQPMAWIHLHDLVEIFARAVTDERMQGPINATAPESVDNRGFTRALATAVRRPAIVPVPGFALRALFGAAAQVLLGGQNARPVRLEELGFRFGHPELSLALADILGESSDLHLARIGSSGFPAGSPAGAGAGGLPDSPYLADRPPRYELLQRQLVPAPIDEVFDFFSRSANLGAITPADMAFEIRGAHPTEMTVGTRIDYGIRLGPVPMQWRTEIEAWEPEGEARRFVDTQLRGPYRCWWHEHRFEARGDHTLMEDRVLYAPPMGPIGGIANRLFIAPSLRRIFAYRDRAIRLRFGESSTPSSTTIVPAAARPAA